MFISKSHRNISMPPGNAVERCEAIEREQQEYAAERQRLLNAQSSPQYDSRHRIGLWEHLHVLHLPRREDHRLVRVIAEQTALTVEQVQQEQRRRASAAAAGSGS